MGYLKGKKIYLTGPMEHGVGEDINWRVGFAEKLREKFDCIVFDPNADPKQQWVPVLEKARANKDLETMRDVARKFVKKDLAEIDRADCIVANLPYGSVTCGSHHEITQANDRKKPILLTCSKGVEFLPYWYYGFIPLDYMFGGLDQVVEYLAQVDEGLHKNNERWQYAYGLI
jgi:nucleoside 2-deoxyribosyltransferase